MSDFTRRGLQEAVRRKLPATLMPQCGLKPVNASPMRRTFPPMNEFLSEITSVTAWTNGYLVLAMIGETFWYGQSQSAGSTLKTAFPWWQGDSMTYTVHVHHQLLEF